MSPSSRSLAKTWPYARHRHFEKSVRESATNWFASAGFSVQSTKPYILKSRDDWTKNIILPEVAELIQETINSREAEGEGFALHKYIHHGLSSQALVFNLVGPLVVWNDLEPLQLLLERQGVEFPQPPLEVEFEYEDRAIFNEDSGQPTSIDVVIRGVANSGSLFVESKFVESAFGGCSVYSNGDCDGRNPAHEFTLCYLHHIGRKYWTLLEKHGFLDTIMAEDASCQLATNYQFFRELIFALEKGGSFVLLSDNRSPTFHSSSKSGTRGLMDFLSKFTPPELTGRVASVSIQDLVSEIALTGRHEWIVDFKRKYGL